VKYRDMWFSARVSHVNRYLTAGRWLTDC
jgi:hypothetical protein